ncbi:acyl-CoA dehydrogenase, C-terminal domain protein [Aeromicrobium marinum DSM 15272]|uniref:Acyl-CoA dehydrogenase, C-terminal domain protein n=1 Tax=Aeromicrobium marinum DSM 15272 TaxID=585531 RepID=E2S8E6_9ACTN|nr:acyl-CoA dehydrogenase family protein [Aeromicrobium marinum]EFQ84451.1 acyl-CoA dehydrogenase, C-terminal domain protein [Aeromicrobium marinum DSM 15272]
MTTAWTTPERIALRDAVTAFTQDQIVPHLPTWEDEGRLPRELHAQAAKAGFLGVGFDEAVGGDGGDLVDGSIVTEAIVQAGGSTGVLASLFTHGISLPHIIDSGNADLIDRYVRPTLAGETIGSLGVTEPGGGSDVANIRTKAVRDDDHYVVNGAKTFITSGVRADFVTTVVRTGGEGYGGISLLVIDKDAPGFTVTGPLRKMGWHCSDTAELSFEDVRVPAENLVGEENGGFVLVMQQFVNERLGLAVQAYATAQRATDLAVEYARQRETFGKPLITRQVIRHKLVDMQRRTAAARALTRQAVERSIDGSTTDPSIILDAVLAKNTAVEAVEHVVTEAVQIFGGMGYMRESEIDRHYRDARIIGIGGGATEVLNDLAAKLLGY